MLPLVMYLFHSLIPEVVELIVRGWIIISGGMIFFFLIRPDHLLVKDPLRLIYGVYIVISLLFFIYVIGVSLESSYSFRNFRLAGNIALFLGLGAGILFHEKLTPFRGRVILCWSLFPLFALILAAAVYPLFIHGNAFYVKVVNLASFISALGMVFLFIPFFRAREFKNYSSPFLIGLAFIFSGFDCLLFTFNMTPENSLIFPSDLMRGMAYFCLMESVYKEAILSPLTTLKIREAELRKEKLFYTQTLAAVKDAVFRYYPDRGYLEVSKVWEDMTGHTVEDVAETRNYGMILFPEDREKLKKAFHLSGRDDWPISEEIRIKHRDGSILWVMVRGRMEKDMQGESCFIGLMTDISWRKKIEQELIQAKEKAEESNRLKTGFLANISHEIRTPLNVLLGFTGLLIKDLPPDHLQKDRLRYIELIRESSNQLISLISDIIDISRIQNERIDLRLQEIELEIYFKKLFTVYRKLMDDRAKREIRLVWRLPDDIPDRIFLNTEIERFHQIWQNLLNNAMKFIEFGQISYGVDSYNTEEGRIVFFVEDTGPGVAAEKDEIIFERFRQGEEGLGRRYGGSGLGLTICRELLQIMKGDIHLDKTYTKGARFLFTLPEFSSREESQYD